MKYLPHFRALLFSSLVLLSFNQPVQAAPFYLVDVNTSLGPLNNQSGFSVPLKTGFQSISQSIPGNNLVLSGQASASPSGLGAVATASSSTTTQNGSAG